MDQYTILYCHYIKKVSIRLCVIDTFWDGTLGCDRSQRYLWRLQNNSREEIGSAEVIQVDLGALHSAGALVRATSFDIEILHQGYSGKERLAALRAGEKLGDEAERLEEAILAFQRVGGCGRAIFNRKRQ
jgi:hypothetical protein